MAESRYVVGIDLGTTNCAVAYVDTAADDQTITPFAIKQVVAPGEVGEPATLPSFLLLPTEHEVAPEALALPWDEAPGFAVGVHARERGSELPHRLVSSAKSWLSFDEVDREGAILPWRGTEEPEDGEGGERISPVEASSRYLAHIRAAWNEVMDEPLEDCDVLLTVPASFDAVARELTVRAAREAGLEHLTLLEEPQAAFYSWLAKIGDGWRNELEEGDVALVCDVGGGTSDFSLIAVENDGGGNLVLERVAVGDHILLGGDNMDLALAQIVIQKLGDKGKKLKGNQYRALVHACRRAKETLLRSFVADEVPISILGSGSKLIGGTLRTELSRDDVEPLLLDGFFPEVEKGSGPKERRALGLRELGLPYATDPAVTRHLAAFLSRNEKRPTAILWNGGVMKGSLIRERVADVVASWFDGERLPALGGTDLDLAVAHGGAYYGLVRRGKGIRIRGGTAHSYYIGVESSMPAIPGFEPPVKALCVAPMGMEEGSSAEVPGEQLGLVVGESTFFRFFASSTRHEDGPGTIIDPEEAELVELAPIEAHLDPDESTAAGDVVPVSLSALVTAVGTLEIWSSASDGDGRWKLEYSVREH